MALRAVEHAAGPIPEAGNMYSPVFTQLRNTRMIHEYMYSLSLPCSRRGLLRPGLHRGGTSAVADVSGGRDSQIQPCIHEYTVFSRVFSHGSNTRIIRVNTCEYVFST